MLYALKIFFIGQFIGNPGANAVCSAAQFHRNAFPLPAARRNQSRITKIGSRLTRRAACFQRDGVIVIGTGGTWSLPLDGTELKSDLS